MVEEKVTKKTEKIEEKNKSVPMDNKMNVKNTAKIKEKKPEKPFFRIIIMTVINFVGLLGLIFVLGLLPDKALELKVLRNLSLSSDQKSKVNTADLQIKTNIELADKLTQLYPDEVGLVEFVQEIERMKAEGKIINFSFVNKDVVKDKTKLLGIPFVVEFEGTWEQIDANLNELQTLPYLIRAITVDVKVKDGEEEGIINFKYGGFIYVGDELAKK